MVRTVSVVVEDHAVMTEGNGVVDKHQSDRDKVSE